MLQTIRLILAVGLISGYLSAASTSHGDEELTVGKTVPDFQVLDQHNKTWDSRDHIGKKIVVLYFYSGDFNFCSMRQAARYRDSLEALEIHGAEVVGISGDSVHAHQLFAETLCLPQTLLADDGSVCRKFGVPYRVGGKTVVKNAAGDEVLDSQGHPITIPKNITSATWTFVVDTDGKVIYREQDVSSVKDCQKVLQFLCEHTKNPAPPVIVTCP